jgi:hypothetical protein
VSNPTNPGATDGAHELSEARRLLDAHRWAVRANLPTHARHAGTTARHAVEMAAYANFPVPERVLRATEVLEGFAAAVERRVTAERGEQERRGLDDADWQRALEREQ